MSSHASDLAVYVESSSSDKSAWKYTHKSHAVEEEKLYLKPNWYLSASFADSSQWEHPATLQLLVK